MRISVIVSAHHSNAAPLALALEAWAVQAVPALEVIVAEDSQAAEVARVVAAAPPALPVVHLNQPNDGFGKWRIVNRAIAAARGDYLVFTDADCLPRADVLAVFARLARRGRFLAAGSHVNLPPPVHAQLTAADVRTQAVFTQGWFEAHGVPVPALRLLPAGRRAAWLDAASPRNAFVGNLSGAWRDDALRVAGFDEAMRYGAADRNFGIRLNNAGVRGQRARHRLVLLHLDHARGWRDLAEVARNRAWNHAVAANGATLPRQSSLLPTPSAPGPG